MESRGPHEVSGLHAVTGLVMGVAGLALGLVVPMIIARIPEPDPDETDRESDTGVPLEEPDPPEVAEEPKEPFAVIAARPGLAWKCSVAGGLCAAVVGLALGWEWSLLVLMPLVPVSVALAVVDWRTRLLPTWLIAPTYVVTVVLVLVSWLLTGDLGEPAPLVRAGIGWAGAGGLYLLLWFVYPRGMGYGDVRLSGILGIALGYLGWSELAVGIYGGFLLGGVLGGLLSLLRRVDRRGYPFGPFMLLGALVGVVLGPDITAALIS